MAEIHKRTLRQNSSAHLWFQHIADTFNEHGLDKQTVLSKRVGIRWTAEAVKNDLFKVLAKAMYQVDSTTQLTKEQHTKVAEMLADVIAKDYGVHVDYPSIETQELREREYR